MEIQVNEKNISIPPETTVIKLLKYINSPKSVAVFVNGKQVLMGEYETYKLFCQDKVKVIKPLGGG